MNSFKRLYCRDINNNILIWDVEVINGFGLVIETGRHLGSTRTIRIPYQNIPEHKLIQYAKRKWLDKINKDGYTEHPGNMYIDVFLDTLTRDKFDAGRRLKPQLFKPFRENKFIYPAAAQPKINGLRGVIRWEIKESNDLFSAKEGAVMRSKNGHIYHVPHITDLFTKDMFGEDLTLAYDGEIYRKGWKINQIKSAVPIQRSIDSKPSKTKRNPLETSILLFDLAMPDIIQQERLDMLYRLHIDYNIPIIGSGDVKITSRIAILEHVIINNDHEAKVYRDKCLAAGHEGIVLRQLDAEYGFGSRTAIGMKYKNFIDTECEIIDIIHKSEDSIRTYICFVLKNDINDYTFESTPVGKQADRDEYIENKQDYIGELATVKFAERSGVKEVPMHSNVVAIKSKADL